MEAGEAVEVAVELAVDEANHVGGDVGQHGETPLRVARPRVRPIGQWEGAMAPDRFRARNDDAAMDTAPHR